MTNLRDHIRKSPHRTRLERLLKRTLPALRGETLEVGSRNRRYDCLFKKPPVAVDIVENKNLDIAYGDVNNLLFHDGTFDNVVCLEVLEYVEAPKQAVREIHRVMKDGGTLILSVPFMFKEHEDKQRYTSAYLKELLADFEVHQLNAIGGSWTVICTIVWGKIRSIRFRPIRYILTALLLPFLLVRTDAFRVSAYASGYFVMATKRS